jgi:hypothetical protein
VNKSREHTPEATFYEYGGLKNADHFLMSGEHTPEATLYECGGLDNADLFLNTPRKLLYMNVVVWIMPTSF